MSFHPRAPQAVLFALAFASPAAAGPPAKFWGDGGKPVAIGPSLQFVESASGSDGRTYFAIRDNRANHRYDIYLQLLGADGEREWGADGIVIANAKDVNTGEEVDQTNPVIVSDGAGGVILGWEDYRYTKFDIFAQRVDAQGTTLWRANGAPVSTACWWGSAICANQKRNLRAASDGLGGAIFVWDEARNGFDLSVWAQRIRPDGSTAWSEGGVPVALVDRAHAGRPQVAGDGQGGAFFTWVDGRPASGVYAQHLDAQGAPSWPVNGVRLGPSADSSQRGHGVVADGQGGMIAVWTDGRNDANSNADIYAQRLDAEGRETWALGGFPVCTRAAHQYTPILGTDGAGGAIFAWEDQGASGQGGGQWLLAQRVDASGVARWTAGGVAVSTGHVGAARMLATEGGAYLVWDEFAHDAERPAVFAQRIGDDGNALWGSGGVRVHHDPLSHYSYGPQIVSDGSQGIVVHWSDYRFTGGTSDAFAQRLNDSLPPPPTRAADLSIALASTPQPGLVGSDLAFTARVANQGPDEATNVAFRDSVLGSHPFVSIRATQGTCGRSNAFACNLGYLPVGSTATVEYVVRPRSPLALPSNAHVVATEADPDATNNLIPSNTPIEYPVPVITALSPPEVVTGGPAFELGIEGTGFESSTPHWNGAPRGIASRTPTLLRMRVNAADIAAEGTAAITVVNLSPGGGPSAVVNLPIVALRLMFSAGHYTTREKQRKVTLSISRTGPTSPAVAVDYFTSSGSANSGTDFAARAGTLSLPAGALTTTLEVPILDDNLDDEGEQFTVSLTNPRGAVLADPSVATVVIEDDDTAGTIRFMTPYHQSGEGRTAQIGVRRSGGRAGGATVQYSTTDGSARAAEDYLPRSGVLTFGPGETLRWIAVPILSDAATEGPETVLLHLTNPEGGARLGPITAARLTIANRNPRTPRSRTDASPPSPE